MFLIMRENPCGGDFPLFVTHTEDEAKQWVEKLQAELKEVQKHPYPTWSIQDVQTGGTSYVTDLLDVWRAKVKGIITIDIGLNGGYQYEDHHYYYEEIEVK